jgi:putative transposase
MEGRALSRPNKMRKTLLHYSVQKSGNRSTIVYLTQCTDKKKRILDNDTIHDLICKSWSEADSWYVGRYVIMPDHIHMFCAPRNQRHSLQSWVKFWKSFCSRNWPNQDDKPIWQKSYWDTQLRKLESYKPKWEYVKNKGEGKLAGDCTGNGERAVSTRCPEELERSAGGLSDLAGE